MDPSHTSSYDFFCSNLQKEKEAREELADLDCLIEEIQRKRTTIQEQIATFDDERRAYYGLAPVVPRPIVSEQDSVDQQDVNRFMSPEKAEQEEFHPPTLDPDGAQSPASVRSSTVLESRQSTEPAVPPSEIVQMVFSQPRLDGRRSVTAFSDVYKHVVEDGNGGFWALSCHLCGANARREKYEYLNGYRGVWAHYRNAHRATVDSKGWKMADTEQLCVKEPVTAMDVERLRRGEKPLDLPVKRVLPKHPPGATMARPVSDASKKPRTGDMEAPSKTFRVNAAGGPGNSTDSVTSASWSPFSFTQTQRDTAGPDRPNDGDETTVTDSGNGRNDDEGFYISGPEHKRRKVSQDSPSTTVARWDEDFDEEDLSFVKRK